MCVNGGNAIPAIDLSERDLAVLRLLELTPATAAQIRKASGKFDADAIRDERRTLERV